jgi:molybdopterin converting factor small subunit
VADVKVELIEIGVRYFAAAGAAAGSDAEQLTVPAGITIGGLVDELSGRSPELARVLRRCSYLCDGVAVRDTAQALRTGNTVDVLPPFAGG